MLSGLPRLVALEYWLQGDFVTEGLLFERADFHLRGVASGGASVSSAGAGKVPGRLVAAGFLA